MTRFYVHSSRRGASVAADADCPERLACLVLAHMRHRVSSWVRRPGKSGAYVWGSGTELSFYCAIRGAFHAWEES